MEGIDINTLFERAVTVAVQIIVLISTVLAAVISAKANGSGAVKCIQQLKSARDNFAGEQWVGERAKLDSVIRGSVERLYRSSQARRYFVLSGVLLAESILLIALAFIAPPSEASASIVDLTVSVLALIAAFIVGVVGIHVRLGKEKSCEYCRGEKPLIAIQDDLFGAGAIIEADELRVYGIYDGGYPNGDERAKIKVCPKCGAKLPVDGARGPSTLEELVPALARAGKDPAAS